MRASTAHKRPSAQLASARFELGEFAGKTVLLAFVPNRAHVFAVRFGGVDFAPVVKSGLQRRIWRGVMPEKLSADKPEELGDGKLKRLGNGKPAKLAADKTVEAKLEVEYVGEKWELLQDPTPIVGDEGEALAAIQDAVDLQLIHLLDHRANKPSLDPKHPDSAEILQAREMFFRFDAWTQPDIALQLLDPAFQKRLSAAAQTLFAIPANPPGRLLGQFERLSQRLYLLACDRAYYLYKGMTPVGNQLGDAQSQGLILQLARYLKPLLALPAANAAAVATDDEASTGVQQAITQFGTGRLHIVAADAPGIQALLNAEPDSAYFFVFAEFAIRASQIDVANRRFWFSIARLFTALQEPFVEVYADPACGRAHCAFRRGNRRIVSPAQFTAIRSRVAYYRQRMPSPRTLPQLERLFATTILWALYDEIVWPQTRCLEATMG